MSRSLTAPGNQLTPRSIVGWILKQRILLVLIALCGIVSLLTPKFLTTTNLINVARQISINGIVAVGMTFVITTGGIDISVGSTVALCGIVAGLLLRSGMPVLIAALAALIVGAVGGLGNGLLVAYGKLLPFVATLGTMNLFRGLLLVISNGQAVWGLPRQFTFIGTGYVLGIPMPVIICAAVFAVGYFLLNHTTIGRFTIAVGGNEEAARLAGVPVRKIKLFVYSFCGLLCGLAGLVLTARLASAQPTAGEGYELTAIASVVIGGTSLLGGKGSIMGTLLGAMVLGVVSNALNLLGISPFYQTMFIGGIVLIAVLFDMLRKN
ncbi:MAG: ABC transporter permease [Limnochordia bacterium]